ncbi:hypothetical protein ACOZ4I_15085 [Haloarcula salina]|uniref:hypothetical protein n=1 Tax=Haloarcula salina TaxID=1429914 RepID=UPI003C6F7E24
MVLLQSLLDTVSGWLTFGLSLLVPGVVASVCWLPFLLAKRLRALFRSLPPTESLAPSYALSGIGASLPFVVGTLVVLATVDTAGRGGAVRLSKPLFTMSLLLFGAYTAGLPVIGVLGLPRAGIDWDPTGYGASTWLVLAGGGAWYALLFAVPLALASIVAALPGGY